MIRQSIMDQLQRGRNRNQLSNQSMIPMESQRETAYLLYKEDSDMLERINSETFQQEDKPLEDENLMNLNSSYRFQKFSNKFLQFFNSQFDASMYYFNLTCQSSITFHFQESRLYDMHCFLHCNGFVKLSLLQSDL